MPPHGKAKMPFSGDMFRHFSTCQHFPSDFFFIKHHDLMGLALSKGLLQTHMWLSQYVSY